MAPCCGCLVTPLKSQGVFCHLEYSLFAMASTQKSRILFALESFKVAFKANSFLLKAISRFMSSYDCSGIESARTDNVPIGVIPGFGVGRQLIEETLAANTNK